jgi:hypothetical protein
MLNKLEIVIPCFVARQLEKKKAIKIDIFMLVNEAITRN